MLQASDGTRKVRVALRAGGAVETVLLPALAGEPEEREGDEREEPRRGGKKMKPVRSRGAVAVSAA